MNLNNVPSLELCKRLKEVGYKQEGEFWWIAEKYMTVFESDGTTQKLTGKHILQNKWHENDFGKIQGETFVAPLASELMERLPFQLDSINGLDDIYMLSITKDAVYYQASYISTTKYLWRPEPEDTSLCNALSKMYIYLAERKLI